MLNHKLLILLMTAGLAACGGGGGGTDSVVTAAPSAQSTTTTSTVVVDAVKSIQVINTVNNDDSSTTLTLSSGGSLATDLSAGKLVHIPAGEDSRFPLGLTAKVSSAFKNADGSNAVALVPAKLVDIATKSSSSVSDIQLSADNFVAVIAPSAVRNAGAAKLTKESKFTKKSLLSWQDGITALNGGLVMRSAKTSYLQQKADSILGGGGTLSPGEIHVGPKSIDLGAFSKDQVNKMSPYSTDGKASLTYEFNLKNIKLTENHDWDTTAGFSTSLKALKFKVEGDFSSNIAIIGDAKGEMGYYATGAWKEVEDETFKLLGQSAQISGLSSKDKVGKYPIAGLVFSVACPTTCPVVTGVTQTPVRAAKPLGIILWIYVNAKGNIGFTGEVGINLAESHLILGVEKPLNGSLAGIHSLTNNGAGRMIEAPYVKGKADLNLRLGASLDVDLFAMGVRFGNAAADVVGNIHTTFDTPTKFGFGTNQLGDGTLWGWVGDACVNTSLGAGLIVSARMNIGAKIDTVFGDINPDPFEYSTQIPSEAEILEIGPKWRGIADKTWYTAAPLAYCFPNPIVAAITQSQTRDAFTGTTTVTFTATGTNLPSDLRLAVAPALACTSITSGTPTATSTGFSCLVSATGIGSTVTMSLSSIKAQNLDSSAIASGGTVIQGVKSIECGSPVINQPMTCTVTGGGFPQVSAAEHFAATSTACSDLTEAASTIMYSAVRTFTCTPTAFGNQTITLVWDKLGAAIALPITIATGTTPALSLAVGSDTGASATDGITNNPRPTLTGTAPAGSTVAIKGNGGSVIGSTIVPASGIWVLTPTSDLPSGSNALFVIIRQGGVTSPASAITTVVIDRVAPSAPVISNAVRQSNGTVIASGTAEANLIITIAWPGGATQVVTTNATGVWTATSAYAVGGSVGAVATDVAGNISVGGTASITIVPVVIAGLLPDTGITAAQCYAAGNNILVSCTSVAAIALNPQQDGMIGRDVVTPNNADGKLGFNFATVETYPITDCVTDNTTGLMWEGKPSTGYRAASNTYTNLDSTTSAQTANASWWLGNRAPTQAEVDANTNSVGYKKSVNENGLCGFSDWRLPTQKELQSIVDYGVAYPGVTVDAAWFPNTQPYYYWTSSAFADAASIAWYGNFQYGVIFNQGRSAFGHVRLVR